MRFVQKGLGNPPVDSDGVFGDLFISINVQRSEYFERLPKGDILINWPVGYSELVLGTQIEVPTLEGRATVVIPPKSKPNQKLRLKSWDCPYLIPVTLYTNVVINTLTLRSTHQMIWATKKKKFLLN